MSILDPAIAGFVSRSAAGLARPKSVSRNITPGRGGVALHWGGDTVPTSGPASARAVWADWQRQHFAKGWADIAYTMGVDNWGFVYAGRGAGVRTAANGTNTGNQNFYAVVWIGGARQTPTRAALRAVGWCIRELREAGGAGLGVKPHSFFRPTACPGPDFRAAALLADGKSLVPTPPPEPEPVGHGQPMVGNWSGKTGIGTYVEGAFYLRDTASSGGADHSFKYGRKSGDVALVAGKNAIVFRGGEWHIRTSLTAGNSDRTFWFGRGGDIPVVGDWSGQGSPGLGVFRDGVWYLRNNLHGGAPDHEFTYGRMGDVPLVGDWNGNGFATVGIRRGRDWHLKNSLRGGAADVAFSYGLETDIPVAGDWSGRGTTTPGVVRRTLWLLKDTATGGNADRVISFTP